MLNNVLFLLKRKSNYNESSDYSLNMSTGLYNSASFVQDMLELSNVNSSIEVVVDANSIDAAVTKHNPSHVIIEALWVPPSKFTELLKIKRHQNVKWIIRLHSDMPFLANEGIAIDWIFDYLSYNNVEVAVNSERIQRELQDIVDIKDMNKKIIYLPNYYPQAYKTKIFEKSDSINVGCFGAVRPLKNHMIQAFAAIEFANKIGKKLKFHINDGRIEQKGQPVLKNLMSLFENVYDQGHELVMHEWMPHEEFIKVCAEMDILLQVSLSETFNIVAADSVSQGIPLVGSREISWSSNLFSAEPTDSRDITKKLIWTNRFKYLNTYINQQRLTRYTDESKKLWLGYLKNGA